jgi:hypothetical protein
MASTVLLRRLVNTAINGYLQSHKKHSFEQVLISVVNYSAVKLRSHGMAVPVFSHRPGPPLAKPPRA